jgi:mannose-6-phosphate isomerase-like protein (cupin superfamily)
MTKYVFHARDAIRYRFPTHTNDLVMDRKDAATSEAFFVILEPGESPPLHVHPDAEQVFFILEGEAEMTIGRERQESVMLRVGDFVRTPPGTWHAVRCTSPGRIVYLSVDCFTGGPTDQEPTWDSHVRVMCAENGWDFAAVRLGPVPDDAPSTVASLPAAPDGR